jgi:hypothetical protein
MVSLLAQLAASLLPKRYRGTIAVTASAATISGLAQFVICLGLFISRYLHFANGQIFGGIEVARRAGEVGGETAIMGSGLFVLAAYMLQPLTILLVYLTLEGAVRLLAANTTGEIVPNLALAGLSWIHAKLGNAASEMALGIRVADEVEPVQSEDVKLRVRSCRQKPDWDQRITIFYNEQLYEIAGTEKGTAPRRYVYLLRPKPANKIVRGTYHYSPNEALSTQ